jgi:hypothetical protein
MAAQHLTRRELDAQREHEEDWQTLRETCLEIREIYVAINACMDRIENMLDEILRILQNMIGKLPKD